MQLSLVSSVPDTGAAHTHSWNIQGGSVLYEKNCYNCHSNDKRNNRPMNVTFNASQTAAVISPGTAPVSVSPAATPDPNYTLTPVTAVNAASVYAGKCAGCHSLGIVDTTTGSGPNLSGKGGLVNGKYPSPGVVSHHGVSLTATEITAMISYLNAN
jgi:mono/diheme cytochrome c family protein